VIDDEVSVAIGIRYQVKIDDADLGEFTSCEGLGAEVVMETREEGGNNTLVWQLPVRIKYPNVKFSRPIGKSTEKVAAWIASMATGFTRRTGSIVATNAYGDVIATWSLEGIVPVRWTGPSMQPDTSKVVTETVEIAHHGFTKGGAS